jgi:two-component system cell cycle sensor histidine kinase PleC
VTTTSAMLERQRALQSRRDARRRAADNIKETRERLINGTTIKPELEYELILMFTRNELSAQATILLVAAIFAFASMFWASWLQAIVWLVMAIGAKVLLLEFCRKFQAQPRQELDLKVWRRRFFLLELLNGSVWAGFALVGVTAAGQGAIAAEHPFSAHVFLFASLIVVLAVRMTFASTVLTLLYAGTVPMTIAVVIRLVVLQDFFHLALAAMALGVHVYFMFLARGLNTTALAMLAFRAEKDGLIAELEEQRAISDAARRRAEDANVAKSRFLATMSHELRTPLNAILGFSEVMKTEMMGPLDNPTYKDYAASIHESGSHLLHLINEILDLSRIEAGRYELKEEPVRLIDVAEDCHRLLKLKADGKGLAIVEAFDERLAQVWADERAVRQICLNLLSNAVKFTPRNGTITIAVAAAEDGGQVLSIRDTGPGIPADEIPKVLQAFGQGSLAHQIAEGGTGLGLPIVQNLIQLHGGTFDLKSELRRGTEVSVTFPRSRVLQAIPPLQPLGHERHRQNALPGERTDGGTRPRRSRVRAIARRPRPQSLPSATSAG